MQCWYELLFAFLLLTHGPTHHFPSISLPSFSPPRSEMDGHASLLWRKGMAEAQLFSLLHTPTSQKWNKEKIPP